jgi:hypothetical protein
VRGMSLISHTLLIQLFCNQDFRRVLTSLFALHSHSLPMLVVPQTAGFVHMLANKSLKHILHHGLSTALGGIPSHLWSMRTPRCNHHVRMFRQSSTWRVAGTRSPDPSTMPRQYSLSPPPLPVVLQAAATAGTLVNSASKQHSICSRRSFFDANPVNNVQTAFAIVAPAAGRCASDRQRLKACKESVLNDPQNADPVDRAQTRTAVSRCRRSRQSLSEWPRPYKSPCMELSNNTPHIRCQT